MGVPYDALSYFEKKNLKKSKFRKFEQIWKNFDFAEQTTEKNCLKKCLNDIISIQLIETNRMVQTGSLYDQYSESYEQKCEKMGWA